MLVSDHASAPTAGRASIGQILGPAQNTQTSETAGTGRAPCSSAGTVPGLGKCSGLGRAQQAGHQPKGHMLRHNQQAQHPQLAVTAGQGTCLVYSLRTQLAQCTASLVSRMWGEGRAWLSTVRVSVWAVLQLAVVQASSWGIALPRAGWDTLTVAATGELGACSSCGCQIWLNH